MKQASNDLDTSSLDAVDLRVILHERAQAADPLVRKPVTVVDAQDAHAFMVRQVREELRRDKEVPAKRGLGGVRVEVFGEVLTVLRHRDTSPRLAGRARPARRDCPYPVIHPASALHSNIRPTPQTHLINLIHQTKRRPRVLRQTHQI